MYRHSSPQNFSTRNGVTILQPTDERNQPLRRLPATVEEANGIAEPAAPVAPGIKSNVPTSEVTPASDVSIRKRAFGEVLQALAFLQGDEAVKARAIDLYSALIENEAAVTALLAEVSEVKIADLRIKHQAVREECRATIARIRELETSLAPLEGTLRYLQAETSKARARHASWKRSEPNRGFPEYADQKAVEAWEAAGAEAQAALTAAQSAEADVVRQYNSIVDAIGKEREALYGHKANIAALNDFDRPGLIEREAQLRAQIDGKPWTDGATGLTSTPMVLL
jgi:hypothetical protein